MRQLAILFVLCLSFILSGCEEVIPDDPTPSETALATDVPIQAADETASPTIVQPVKPTADNGIIEIKEKLFIAQLNDIYLNQDDYLGMTVKFEGMFTQYTWAENNMTYYLVYRNSPGCCGADGQAGFEVVWADDSGQPYPNENDWCEVVGTLEIYEELGQSYLRIALDSLTVSDNRGAEFVSQ